jgi:hypothetical protein
MSTIERPQPRPAAPRRDLAPAAPHLLLAVRTTLVRRDRLRLADAVCALLDHRHGCPACSQVPDLDDQVGIARPVLRDIEHLLRGDGPLDQRGVQRIGDLLADVRAGRLAPCDPLAVDTAAREARRLLVPHAADPSSHRLDALRPDLDPSPAPRVAR